MAPVAAGFDVDVTVLVHGVEVDDANTDVIPSHTRIRPSCNCNSDGMHARNTSWFLVMSRPVRGAPLAARALDCACGCVDGEDGDEDDVCEEDGGGR